MRVTVKVKGPNTMSSTRPEQQQCLGAESPWGGLVSGPVQVWAGLSPVGVWCWGHRDSPDDVRRRGAQPRAW